MFIVLIFKRLYDWEYHLPDTACISEVILFDTSVPVCQGHFRLYYHKLMISLPISVFSYEGEGSSFIIVKQT